MATKASTAVAVQQTLSSAELVALLQEAGWAEKPSGESLPRMSLSGNLLATPDGEQFIYNPKHPEIPAVTVRIVKPPEEYNAFFLNSKNADAMGRPDLANQFSKRYMQPDATRKVWESDAAFDDIRARTDLYDDYGNALKASWKGDLQLQIVPDDGQLTGSEQVYILTLSTTSLIEFKGTGRAPSAGSVSEENFITKLANFAISKALETGTPPKKAVLDAMTSLTLGGVVAEGRILMGENKEKNQKWSVLSWTPIHIEPMQEGDQLLTTGDLTANPDEVGV